MKNDLLPVPNLNTIDFFNLEFNTEAKTLSKYIDYDYKTNLLLTNVLELNYSNVYKILKNNINPAIFKVLNSPIDIQETCLFKKSFLSKINLKNTLPPLSMNHNYTHSINYLAYLCFVLDLKKQEIESYKISHFHDKVISFLKIFDDFGYLDQEDEQGYTFNDYVFIFPSLTFISLLENASILNYKFNKANNKIFEEFLNNHALSIYTEKNSKKKSEIDSRVSQQFADKLINNELTNSFSSNMAKDLITVYESIQSVYDKNIMKKDIILSKSLKKEDLRKF